MHYTETKEIIILELVVRLVHKYGMGEKNVLCL